MVVVVKMMMMVLMRWYFLITTLFYYMFITSIITATVITLVVVVTPAALFVLCPFPCLSCREEQNSIPPLFIPFCMWKYPSWPLQFAPVAHTLPSCFRTML